MLPGRYYSIFDSYVGNIALLSECVRICPVIKCEFWSWVDIAFDSRNSLLQEVSLTIERNRSKNGNNSICPKLQLTSFTRHISLSTTKNNNNWVIQIQLFVKLEFKIWSKFWIVPKFLKCCEKSDLFLSKFWNIVDILLHSVQLNWKKSLKVHQLIFGVVCPQLDINFQNDREDML